MSHDISKMVYVGQEPWHGLGTALPANADYDAIIQAAGFYTAVERSVFSPPMVEAIPDRKALFREDTGEYLSTVSKGYEVVQFAEVARTLVEAAGGVRCIFHTAGTLGRNGVRGWLLGELPEPMLVRGDKSPIKRYVLGYCGHDGTTAITLKNVATRVVCQNTLGVALSEQDGAEWHIPHTTSAKTQTTKTTREWDDVLDGDVLPLHEHSLDEQSDEPLTACEVQCVEAVAHGRGEGGHVRTELVEAHPIRLLHGELLGPLTRSPQRILQLLAALLEFLHFNGTVLVGINESANLPFQSPARLLQACALLCSRLRVVSAVLPGRDFLFKQLWLLEPLAESLPHHFVQLLGAYTSSPAALRASGIDGVSVRARVIEILVALAVALHVRANHPQPTLAAHHQGAQQVLMLDVARGDAFVTSQALPHLTLHRLVHQGRYRHRNPLSLGPGPGTAAGILPVGSGIARPGGLGGLALAVIGRAGISRVGENGVHRGGAPERGPPRAHALGIEAPGHLAGTQILFQHPPVHVPHVRGLLLVDDDDALRQLRSAHHPVAVGPRGERQHLPGPHLVHAAAARALENLRPLVLGDDALHLYQQRVLWPLASGPLNEMHLHVAPGQLLQNHRLVDVAARQPVGRVHQHEVNEAVGRRVPQGIQSGSVQTTSAVALVHVAVVGGHREPQSFSCLLQGGHLRGHRPLFFLTRR